MVTWNGRPFKRGLTQVQAESFANRWQGKLHHSGMMKHTDKGDYFEAKRDLQEERDFDERYDVMQRGGRQRVIAQYRIGEGGSFGD